MVKVDNTEDLVDLSLCKEVFEKFGERRLISRGEYFARSGDIFSKVKPINWKEKFGLSDYIFRSHSN